MKHKKGKVKRILLIILSLLVLTSAVYLSMIKIISGKIPHHFASAKEGRDLMLSNTEYYGNFTQNDIDFRLQKSGGTLDELLDVSTAEIKNFSFFEKIYIDSRIAKMKKTLDKNGYELPPVDEIVFVKSDMEVESGASGYTHGTQIYLNSAVVTAYSLLSFIPQTNQLADELLWHEMFHCLTRCNPDFRKEMYSLINFSIADSDFELPPSVLEYYINNPDVEHHDSYATFNIDGKDTDCYTAFITTKHFEEAKCGFMQCNETVLVPVDGTDKYYTTGQASNFDDVFGRNTPYTCDPEECLADNFSYAMTYGIEGIDKNGYPDSEIIQGIIDIMSK